MTIQTTHYVSAASKRSYWNEQLTIMLECYNAFLQKDPDGRIPGVTNGIFYICIVAVLGLCLTYAPLFQCNKRTGIF